MINNKIKLYIKYLYLRTKKIKLTKPKIKKILSEAERYIFENINENKQNRFLSTNLRYIREAKTETIHIVLEALYKYANYKDSIINLDNNSIVHHYNYNWINHGSFTKEQFYYFISNNHACPLYILKEILNYIDSQNKIQNKYSFVFENIRQNILKNKNTSDHILKEQFVLVGKYYNFKEIIISNPNCPNEIYFDLFSKSKKELGNKFQSMVLLQMMNRGLLTIKTSP